MNKIMSLVCIGSNSEASKFLLCTGLRKKHTLRRGVPIWPKVMQLVSVLPFPYEKVSSVIGTVQGLWEWTDTAGRVSYRFTGSLQHKRGSRVVGLDCRMGLS